MSQRSQVRFPFKLEFSKPLLSQLLKLRKYLPRSLFFFIVNYLMSITMTINKAVLSLNSPGRRLRQMEQAELLTISYKNEILLLFSYITNSNATVHFFPFFNNENTCHHFMANAQDVNSRTSLRWPVNPVNKAISLPSKIFWFLPFFRISLTASLYLTSSLNCLKKNLQREPFTIQQMFEISERHV